jgi:hypothetical protein
VRPPPKAQAGSTRRSRPTDSCPTSITTRQHTPPRHLRLHLCIYLRPRRPHLQTTISTTATNIYHDAPLGQTRERAAAPAPAPAPAPSAPTRASLRPTPILSRPRPTCGFFT